MVLLFAVFITGCNAGTIATATYTASATVAERRIELMVRQVPGVPCVRKPRGSESTIYVRRGAVSAATAAMRNKGIAAHVAVSSIYRLNTATADLASRVRREQPPRMPPQDVYPELFSGHTACPVVHLEVGERGKVELQVMAWARATEDRFGADRVRIRYLMHAEAA